MHPSHNSFRIRQQLVRFSRDEVYEVLRQSTYAGTLNVIEDINKRHELNHEPKTIDATTDNGQNPSPDDPTGTSGIQERNPRSSLHEAA